MRALARIICVVMFITGMAAHSQNVLTFTSGQGHPADEVEIHVGFDNTDASVAFQLEIPLDAALTYVPGSCVLAERDAGFALSVNMVGNNLNIIAYSMQLSPMSGNSGDIVVFRLRLGSNPGTYVIASVNTVFSNAGGQPLDVAVNGGSVTLLSPKVQINTPVIDFGHVPIRGTYNANLSITNVGNEPLVLNGLEFTAEEFSAPSFVEQTVEAGNSVNVVIRYAPMVAAAVSERVRVISNAVNGTQQVKLTADPYSVNELHFVGVTGYSDSIVTVSLAMNNMDAICGMQCGFRLPSAIQYVEGSIELSERKTNHVAVGSMRGDTLTLLAYSPNNAAFTGDDGTLATFQLRLKGSYGSYYMNMLTPILSSSAGINVLSGFSNGYVTIKSPSIYCNSSINMGNTPVTDTARYSFRVNNWGNAPLIINEIVFNHDDFGIAEELPLVLDSYYSKNITVEYSGLYEGDFSATMQVYSNDPVNGMKVVTVTGQRYEPNSLAISTPATAFFQDVNLRVELNNYTGITAVQFDMTLPEGYDVAASDFVKTERCSSHNMSAINMEQNVWRVVLFSMNNALISGNSGPIINITMHPDANTEAGTFDVNIDDIIISDVNGVNKTNVTSYATSFTTFSYMLGDVNGDQSVNVLDVVTTVLYGLGGQPVSFVFAAADVNFDGNIDVLDIVGIVNISMGNI